MSGEHLMLQYLVSKYPDLTKRILAELIRECPACRGKGVLKAPDDVYDKCHICKGNGTLEEKEGV